ncbi:hypothetical protein CFC21_082847 [Triticum aestivum]|uniref:Uncharacterized protein n=2 Tax=Triticum aestivum TaxID=4565 RepID=A0A3B6NN49_WHEAT|nr:hypothetical protein CFC21_082847 [Triticum aestivum]
MVLAASLNRQGGFNTHSLGRPRDDCDAVRATATMEESMLVEFPPQRLPPEQESSRTSPSSWERLEHR